MKANMFFEDDIATMLDSLLELFREYGNDVTATLIAERMEQKLHRRRLAVDLKERYSGCLPTGRFSSESESILTGNI